MASLIALTWPTPAQAHLVTTGLGPVYDGVGHFALTPEDFLPVIAISLFAGLRGAKTGRIVLFVLPVSWLVGGVAALLTDAAATTPIAPFSILLTGLLVAADVHLPSMVVAALVAIVGVMHGFLNGAAMRPASVGLLGLLGIMTTLFVVSALLAALVISLKRPWTRIVVRVAGSWIAAIGLLLIGWTLRPKQNHLVVHSIVHPVEMRSEARTTIQSQGKLVF